jgi:hypothetical protein
MNGCLPTTSVAIQTVDWSGDYVLGLLETALEQTAQLMDGCDEEPESDAEEDQAE